MPPKVAQSVQPKTQPKVPEKVQWKAEDYVTLTIPI